MHATLMLKGTIFFFRKEVEYKVCSNTVDGKSFSSVFFPFALTKLGK